MSEVPSDFPADFPSDFPGLPGFANVPDFSDFSRGVDAGDPAFAAGPWVG